MYEDIEKDCWDISQLLDPTAKPQLKMNAKNASCNKLVHWLAFLVLELS
jgi:hypothetical protein